MILFSNFFICVVVVLIVVCGMKFFFLIIRIFFFRLILGKIGEQDISVKEKKIVEEDLKLNYCGMCFIIVVFIFLIYFGDFFYRVMKENV